MTPALMSLAAAAFAAALNLEAARRQRSDPTPPYRHSWMARALVGAFAAVYVALFWTLNFTDIEQGDWSRNVIWLTPLAFLTAWSVEPASYLIRRYARPRKGK